jgi:hypothetical protein
LGVRIGKKLKGNEIGNVLGINERRILSGH